MFAEMYVFPWWVSLAIFASFGVVLVSIILLVLWLNKRQ
jgi:hypothetical protein